MRVALFVGEGEGDGHVCTAVFAWATILVRATEFEHLALGDEVGCKNLSIVDDGCEQRGVVGADQLAEFDGLDAEAARDGGLDLREFEVE